MKNFFSEWSPEMAWVLGLIFSDGHIKVTRPGKPGRACKLDSIDIDLLEQVRSLTGVTTGIHKHKNRSIYSLQVGATTVCEYLEDYGVLQTKTHTMEFPDVPPSCLPHFVRGLWDGDGCIFSRYRTRNRNRLTYTQNEVTTEYVCGSLMFITSLHDTIAQYVGIGATIKAYAQADSGRAYRCPPGTGSYSRISYYHRNSIRLLDWLYQDSTPGTRLARKYSKASPFLSA